MSGGFASRLIAAARAYQGFQRDGGVLLGAAVAYYSLFAFAPMLLLAVAGAQRLLGQQRGIDQLTSIADSVVGPRLAAAVAGLLRSWVAGTYDTAVAVVGVVLLLWAVVVAYQHVHEAFNAMWHVRLRADVPLLRRLWIGLPRLALVLLPATMLVAVTIFSSVLVWATERFARLRGANALLATLGSPLAMALAAFVALLVLYRFVPDARVRTRDVALPAAAVAVAWWFGTYLYGAYLSYAGTVSVAGAAGAVVLLLVWMNYSARAVLFGCWWSRLRAEVRGGGGPGPDAERVDAASRHAAGIFPETTGGPVGD